MQKIKSGQVGVLDSGQSLPVPLACVDIVLFRMTSSLALNYSFTLAQRWHALFMSRTQTRYEYALDLPGLCATKKQFAQHTKMRKTSVYVRAHLPAGRRGT